MGQAREAGGSPLASHRIDEVEWRKALSRREEVGAKRSGTAAFDGRTLCGGIAPVKGAGRTVSINFKSFEANRSLGLFGWAATCCYFRRALSNPRPRPITSRPNRARSESIACCVALR